MNINFNLGNMREVTDKWLIEFMNDIPLFKAKKLLEGINKDFKIYYRNGKKVTEDWDDCPELYQKLIILVSYNLKIFSKPYPNFTKNNSFIKEFISLHKNDFTIRDIIKYYLEKRISQTTLTTLSNHINTYSQDETIITQEDYQYSLKVIQKYREQLENELHEIDLIENPNAPRNKRIIDFNLSTRAYKTLLTAFNISEPEFKELKARELSKISRYNLIRLRTCGKKTLSEITEICESCEIRLKP